VFYIWIKDLRGTGYRCMGSWNGRNVETARKEFAEHYNIRENLLFELRQIFDDSDD
jgi:hypothetical protein